MTAPNQLALTSWTRNTASIELTTSEQVILTNPENSDTILTVTSLRASNIQGANSQTLDVYYYDSDTTASTYISKGIAVPAGASLIVVTSDAPINLGEGKSLRALADSNSSIDVLCNYDILT